MKALLVDDEPLARRELRQLLGAHPEFEDFAEAGDLAEALSLTRTFAPDVVFLDIQLRGETGFDYFDQLGPSSPQIVMVTAFDQHALRAFECAAVDYLLKPVDEARLAATVSRLASRSSRSRSDNALAALKVGSQVRLIPWADILRVSTEGNYTRVYLRDRANHLILRPLKEWLSLAPAGHFVRVHRTTVVRRADIVRLEHNAGGERSVYLSDASSVPVGRLYWSDLKRALLR